MYLDRLFKLMAEKQASDLFISCGAPINMKVNGVVAPLSTAADGHRHGAPRRLRAHVRGAGARRSRASSR